jgi:hypothetical protein
MTPAGQPEAADMERLLQTLKRLREQGLISEEAYRKKSRRFWRNSERWGRVQTK